VKSDGVAVQTSAATMDLSSLNKQDSQSASDATMAVTPAEAEVDGQSPVSGQPAQAVTTGSMEPQENFDCLSVASTEEMRAVTSAKVCLEFGFLLAAR
jgi:hypothetical protein